MSKIIMTVDDSASVRQMVSFTLKQAGYQVVEAVDGKDALSKLHGAAVQMVLTDLNMPNMNGIELIRNVQGQSRLQVHPHRDADHRVAGGDEARGESCGSHRMDCQTL